MTRREFRIISGQGTGSPEWQATSRRKPTRRQFKTIHCGITEAEPAAATTVEIERYVKLVGQLAPETGLENKAWSTSVISPQNAYSFSLHAIWNPLATPTYTEAGTGRPVYVQRMNGIRFAIEGYQTTWTQNLQTQFTNLVSPPVGKSSLLPPSTSHMTVNLQSVKIPHMGFNHYWYNGGGNSTTEVETTHYRIWIDGVDKTGIVSLGSPFQHTYAGGNIGGLLNRRIGGYLLASVPAGSYYGKSVWFDVWVSVKTYRLAWYNGGNTSAAGSYEPVCQVDSTWLYNRAIFNSANANGKRYAGDSYKLTFSNNGPGGASTLNVATAGGWTLTNANAAFSLVKPATGSISLNWSLESPILTFSTNAAGSVRYMPVDTGNYVYRNQNGSTIKWGTWNPQGATVFQPVAIQIAGGWYAKGSSNVSNSAFSPFPSTITVEKL